MAFLCYVDSKADLAESTTTVLKAEIDDITGFKTDRKHLIYSRYMKSGLSA